MNKRIFQISTLFIGLIILNSCATARYERDYRSSRDLNIFSGKWLVTEIQSNFSHFKNKKINRLFTQKLKKLGADSIYFIDSIRINYTLPKHFSFEPTEKQLLILEQTTDFDFIINLKASNVRSEVGDILLTEPLKNEKSVAELHITAYDIKLRRQIYNLKITGVVEVDEDSKVRLAKSSPNLLDAAFRRAIKDIKKYSKRYR